ncbi:MAG: [FeFe] hydrogenase H-cluster radical SAM maturase HydE [bacterium]
MINIITKAEETHKLTKEEIITLLESSEFEKDLFEAADRTRNKYVGDEVHLRGLIEFSNICKQNCLYCGLRRDNKKVNRYRLEVEEILRLAHNASLLGYKTIVLQSGEDAYYNVEILEKIIKGIHDLGVAITLSIGERSEEEYKKFREAGADRFLVRIETTDVELYHKLNPGMDFDNRVECLKNLRKYNYEVGTGCMVGLPGQTLQSLAEDILFFKEIGADMIGIGPFIPNPDTPLREEKGGEFIMALKVMAITRLLLPDINLPATTAMEALNPNGRFIALQSGANVIMPNVSEGEYREFYQLYPGKPIPTVAADTYRQNLANRLSGIGRYISDEAGTSKAHIRKNA